MSNDTNKTYRTFVTTLYQGEYRVRTSNNPNYIKVIKHAGFEDIHEHTFPEEITKAEGVELIKVMDEFQSEGSKKAIEHYYGQMEARAKRLAKAQEPKGKRGRKPKSEEVDDSLLVKAAKKAKKEQEITVDSIVDDPIFAMAANKAKEEVVDSIEVPELEEEPF